MGVPEHQGRRAPHAPPHAHGVHAREAYDLGVDLGTTWTAAAIRPLTGPSAHTVQVVPLQGDGVQVPSVLFIEPDGSLLVGAAAERRAPDAPQRVVREFKRRLGDETPIVVGGEGHSADGIAAEMVRWVVDRVAVMRGRLPRRIVVAHPAGWGAYRRRVFHDAVRTVGLHGVTLVCEPEAAALAHSGSGHDVPGRTVAVYDLGGGTFDAAVVRTGPHGGVVPLGRGQGIEALGGIDFDEALFWHVCAELGGAVAALDPADPATVRAVAALRRACVTAKETLSVDTEAVVPVELATLSTSVRITRREFEDAIEPSIGRTIDVLGEVLDAARVPEDRLDEILLVGGSARIPLVALMLGDEFGCPVHTDPDPTTAVARGAAVAAARGAVASSGPSPATTGAPRARLVPRLVPTAPVHPAGPPATAAEAGGEDGDDAVTESLHLAALRPEPVRPPVRSADDPPPPSRAANARRRRRRIGLAIGSGVMLVAGAVVAVTVPIVPADTVPRSVTAPLPAAVVPGAAAPAAHSAPAPTEPDSDSAPETDSDSAPAPPRPGTGPTPAGATS